MAEHNAFYIYLISFLIDCVFPYNNLLLQSSGGITRYRLLCKGCSRQHSSYQDKHSGNYVTQLFHIFLISF